MRFEFLILALTLFQQSASLNILAIVSLPLKSHYMAFHNLFRQLAIKGHSVTIMNNYPDQNKTANLDFVDIGQVNVAGGMPRMDYYESFDSRLVHLYNYYRHFVLGPISNQEDCLNFFTNENVLRHRAKEIKYDVVFVEQFFGDCGLVYAMLNYDAPIIGITSHTLLPMSYSRLGIPFDISTDPFYFAKEGPNPSLLAKIETFFMLYFHVTLGRVYVQKPIYEVFKKYMPDADFDIEKLARDRIKMMFAYQHYALTGARLLAPQVLEIAGLHIGGVRNVPEDIERFLSKADKGAIFVSFGSNLKASTMSPGKTQQFLSAFKRLGVRVLWKHENATLPGAGSDVYTSAWMPQLDILCHPKILAFISHGGMLSLSETVHCGKPALIIPFFGDQFSNAGSARAGGFAEVLYFDQVNEDNLVTGIKRVLSDEMQQNARKVSRLWHDRQTPVMDSAIFWTEFVARHESAPPPLPSQNATWFKRALLDVAVVLVLILLGLILVVYVIIKVFLAILGRLLGFRGKSKKD